MRGKTSSTSTTIVSCPECGRIAAVEWRRRLHATPGATDHVKVSCLDRHWFLMPEDQVRAAASPGAPGPAVGAPPAAAVLAEAPGPAVGAPPAAAVLAEAPGPAVGAPPAAAVLAEAPGPTVGAPP